MRCAGQAVVHTEGHGTASGGDAEQNGSGSRCASHSDHIWSTRVGAQTQSRHAIRDSSPNPQPRPGILPGASAGFLGSCCTQL